MSSPQFTKRARQPLDAGGIDRACARMRSLLDEIEINRDCMHDTDEARMLSRDILELRSEAMRLCRRYCEREAYRQADGTIAEPSQ